MTQKKDKKAQNSFSWEIKLNLHQSSQETNNQVGLDLKCFRPMCIHSLGSPLHHKMLLNKIIDVAK